jgi:hypothetical protein
MESFEMRAVVVAVALALAGCVAAEEVHVVHAFCVTPVQYTAAQRSKAADELIRLGPDSELAVMITDYGKQRAAERECLKHQ